MIVQSTMTAPHNAAASDAATFYSAAAGRKSASAATTRRAIHRGGSPAESTRFHGAGTWTTATTRQSLLGRPVNVRHHSRRDARYRRFQVAVYNFLERPKNWRSILYHMLV